DLRLGFRRRRSVGTPSRRHPVPRRWQPAGAGRLRRRPAAQRRRRTARSKARRRVLPDRGLAPPSARWPRRNRARAAGGRGAKLPGPELAPRSQPRVRARGTLRQKNLSVPLSLRTSIGGWRKRNRSVERRVHLRPELPERGVGGRRDQRLGGLDAAAQRERRAVDGGVGAEFGEGLIELAGGGQRPSAVAGR